MFQINVPGLFCRDSTKRDIKISHLYNLLRKYDIVLVQETHGDDADLDQYTYRFNNTHHCHFSPGPDSSTGGCLTFVSNRIYNRTCNPQFLIS